MRNGSIFLLLAILLMLPACAHHKDKAKKDEAPKNAFSIDSNNVATVSGAVITNESDCATGGACYLTLNAAAHEIHVVYHHNSGCKNSDAVKTATTFKPGDLIKASGAYNREGDFGIVDACAESGALEKQAAPAP